MKSLLLFVQILSALVMILLVLLHSAKGEGLGSIGNTARLFSTQKGLEAGLNKVTSICAAIFMGSALLTSFL